MEARASTSAKAEQKKTAEAANLHHVIDLFRCADHTVKRSISKAVEKTGVYRSQHRLLMILGKHPECSQSEIAEILNVSPAAVTVSLKKLEKGGYISRQSHENDNRINQIKVTEKGREAIDLSIEQFRMIDGALLAGFSDEELSLLEGFLARIIENGAAYYQELSGQER